MPRATPYRPDIDGLRAIAVLLVVASHLRVPHLLGGYVGVDVFFVISGYLITSIITREIERGTFTLRVFYLRRLRRIAPALFVMLACTIPFARHYLFPTELAAYARSLLAAAFACSNTIFWGWRGYFDTSNELKPLLHTWSLGVEEQFYLAFPLLVLFLVRRRNLRTTLLILAAISFAAACWFVPHNPRVAFFAAPLRAWELLLGAILTQRAKLETGSLKRETESKTTRFLIEAAALLGLGLILTPAILYTDETAFPGLSALAPCLGAALLITTGDHRKTLARRLLSFPPFVFTGLVSYSIYLWHWPVIVFYNLRHNFTCEAAACTAPLDTPQRLRIFGLTVVLALLSWLCVELPFRYRRFVSTRALLSACGTALVFFITYAAYALHTEGEPQRFPPRAVAAAAWLDFDTHDPWRWGSCALSLDESATHFDRQKCLPYTAGHKHYLLLGDSHAAQLWPGLHAVFPELEIGQVNVAGCNLLPFKQQDMVPTCRATAQHVYRDLLPSGRVDTLIVDGQWKPEDLPHISELIAYAREHHIKILLLGLNISYTQSAPRLIARLETQHRLDDAASFIEKEQPLLDLQMAALARNEWHIPYVSFFSESCSQDLGCTSYTRSGDLLMLDRHHLTPAGAAMVAQALRDRHRLP